MLEVIALNVEDARQAHRGGADRIELVGTMDKDGLSPSLDMLKAVQDEVPIPVRVMLRTEAGFATSEPQRLIELAEQFCEQKVDGLVLGYVKDGQVDELLMRELLAHIDVPYTFHRAIDHADDYEAAFNAVTHLPGQLTAILTAGSPAGVEANIDRLRSYAQRNADLMLIGGGLRQIHVPALKEAGLQHFHVGGRVRPEGDFAQTVDPRLVASWKEIVG